MGDLEQVALMVAGMKYRDARRTHAYEIVRRKRLYGNVFRHTPEEIEAEGQVVASLTELQRAAMAL